MCHFLVAVNSILGELGNGVDGSLFADDIAIYCISQQENKRMAGRALQKVTNKLDACTADKGLILSTSKTINMTFRKGRKRKENQWKTH